MRNYYDELLNQSLPVRYVNAYEQESDIRTLITVLASEGVNELQMYDVCDDWLQRRITQSAALYHIKVVVYDSPMFLNTNEDLKPYFDTKSKYFQTDFYIQQRKKHSVLTDEHQKPVGGKWSFDADNRKKYPTQAKPPVVSFPSKDKYWNEAREYVNQHFPKSPGSINAAFTYPRNAVQAEQWLRHFIKERFNTFGDYEDAIVKDEAILHHSVLTPMLNTGLLTPKQVIDEVLAQADHYKIPLNSLEGFIRQIIGWREFIRGVYVMKGRQQRTTNFWKFNREMPRAFYEATTGIEPVDATIRKVLETGYCHHIERLMILGNFMLLCRIHPDAVYRWFMELFIDAYDWVMVPNVYGMSQFADGGLMATKPYISGSSYILKMSNYKRDAWCDVWDALFWSFMNDYRSFFSSNSRLGMLLKSYDKMDEVKRKRIQEVTSGFLSKLFGYSI